MAQQARAIRTRQLILQSAASVFAERGYERTTIGEILARAGVTKGALYFHFASKEEVALGVLSAQMFDDPIPPQTLKVQELVDQGFLLAHRLQHDALVRASVALALDPGATGVNRAEPFRVWIDSITAALTIAKERGELLPHVNAQDSAELFSAAFSGVQATSAVLCDRADLMHRVAVLVHHVMPSICTPAVLISLDVSMERAELLAAEYEAARRRSEENLTDSA